MFGGGKQTKTKTKNQKRVNETFCSSSLKRSISSCFERASSRRRRSWFSRLSISSLFSWENFSIFCESREFSIDNSSIFVVCSSIRFWVDSLNCSETALSSESASSFATAIALYCSTCFSLARRSATRDCREALEVLIRENRVNQGSKGFKITRRKKSKSKSRSEERRVGKECRSRWSPYH